MLDTSGTGTRDPSSKSKRFVPSIVPIPLLYIIVVVVVEEVVVVDVELVVDVEVEVELVEEVVVVDVELVVDVEVEVELVEEVVVVDVELVVDVEVELVEVVVVVDVEVVEVVVKLVDVEDVEGVVVVVVIVVGIIVVVLTILSNSTFSVHPLIRKAPIKNVAAQKTIKMFFISLLLSIISYIKIRPYYIVHESSCQPDFFCLTGKHLIYILIFTMGELKISKTNISGILLIEPKAFFDDRGFFMECYSVKDFQDNGFNGAFVQDNRSASKKGVLRGLHYQNHPSPMGKLVSCIKGKIFDVGVDIRKGSPTFCKWYGAVISEENMKMLYFPPGFAHGFLSLEDDTHVYYKCTGLYSKENESAIAWNDPEIGIKWPLAEVGGLPILSERDKVHPKLKDAVNNHKFGEKDY
jgi:dTDP-4-dehydrorhamnose 3,5-epimerase